MFLRLESLICFSSGDTTRKEAIGKPSLHSDYTRGRGIYSRYLTSDSGVSCSIEDNNDSLRSLTRFSRQTLCRALDESSHRQMVADAENSRRGRAQGGPQISRPSSLGSRRDGGQWTHLNSLTRHDASGIFDFRDLAAVLVCCYWLSEYETVETSGRRSARLLHRFNPRFHRLGREPGPLCPTVHVVLGAQPKLARYLPREWERPCCG